MSVGDLVGEVEKALDRKDGEKLERLLFHDFPQYDAESLEFLAQLCGDMTQPERDIARGQAQYLAHADSVEGAFDGALVAVRGARSLMGSGVKLSYGVLITRLIGQLVSSGMVALDAVVGEEERSEKMSRIENEAKGILVYLLNDTGSDSEKIRRMALHVANPLLRLYNHLGISQLGVKLKSNVEKALENVDALEAAPRYTYMYYIGRLELLRNHLREAREMMTDVFERLPVSAPGNKRRALMHLVPLRLLDGVYPARELLARHDLDALWPLVDAVRLGDFAAYRRELCDLEEPLLRMGLLLVFERLRMLVFRNLLRRIFLLSERSTQIKLRTVAAILLDMGEGDGSIDEVSCWVATLIRRNMLRGYISLSHNVVVVSAKQTFPRLGRR